MPSVWMATETTPAFSSICWRTGAVTFRPGSASAMVEASSAARMRSSSHCSSKLARVAGSTSIPAPTTNRMVRTSRRADRPPGQSRRREGRSAVAGVSVEGGGTSAMLMRYFTIAGLASPEEFAC